MLNRRTFMQSLGLATASLTLPAATSRAAQRDGNPNILFIIVDDLGPHDLGCMGGSIIKTPNIDRIAKEGIRFTQAYSGCTVCAPARSTLMTGKHTGHTTVRGNTGGISLDAGDVTVAQVLQKAGYACGGFGKWGIGDVGTPGVPEKHGFDIFFGYYHQVHAHTYYPRYLWRNSEKVPLPGNDRPQVDHRDGAAHRADKLYVGEQFSHHLILEEAKKFIRENKDGPFLCYCPWTPPHGVYPKPIDDPAMDDFKDRPWPENAKVYASMVAMIDRNVGEMLALLEELDIDRETIVFFCSDNGGLGSLRELLGSNGPLRGGKGTLYEGGLRIPLLARWPGKIPRGRQSALHCYFPDIMPTFADLAGAQQHLPPNLDGISILPALLGKPEQQKRHDFLYWEFPKINFNTQKLNPDGLAQALRQNNWKIVRHNTREPFELYDLDADIGEEHNRARDHPDMLAQLTTLVDAAHSPMKPQTEQALPPKRRHR